MAAPQLTILSILVGLYMASFRDMLAECESLISMEEGLNLVEMLPADELGCRVAQSALRSVMNYRAISIRLYCGRGPQHIGHGFSPLILPPPSPTHQTPAVIAL